MTRKTNLAVADIGYGWEKAKLSGGKVWRQPSVVGTYHKLHDRSIKEDDVRYTDDEKQYFIGDLAIRHSKIHYASTGENKAQTWTSDVLLKAALGSIAPNDNLYLVTGLPVDYYFNQKDDMEALLHGFNSDKQYQLQIGKGRVRKVRPWILRHKVVPQPLGAAMNYLLDDDGQIKNKETAKKKILVLDPGYGTFDILEIDRMEIGPNSCSPEGLGYDTAYKLIQDYLRDNIGKAPSRFKLDKYILDGEYEGYNLEVVKRKAFEALAKQIQLEIENLKTNYYRYIVTGGWAELISEFLDIPKEKIIIMNQTGNIDGFLKIGARLWRTVL